MLAFTFACSLLRAATDAKMLRLLLLLAACAAPTAALPFGFGRRKGEVLASLHEIEVAIAKTLAKEKPGWTRVELELAGAAERAAAVRLVGAHAPGGVEGGAAEFVGPGELPRHRGKSAACAARIELD